MQKGEIADALAGKHIAIGHKRERGRREVRSLRDVLAAQSRRFTASRSAMVESVLLPAGGADGSIGQGVMARRNLKRHVRIGLPQRRNAEIGGSVNHGAPPSPYTQVYLCDHNAIRGAQPLGDAVRGTLASVWAGSQRQAAVGNIAQGCCSSVCPPFGNAVNLFLRKMQDLAGVRGASDVLGALRLLHGELGIQAADAGASGRRPEGE